VLPLAAEFAEVFLQERNPIMDVEPNIQRPPSSVPPDVTERISSHGIEVPRRLQEVSVVLARPHRTRNVERVFG